MIDEFKSEKKSMRRKLGRLHHGLKKVVKKFGSKSQDPNTRSAALNNKKE